MENQDTDLAQIDEVKQTQDQILEKPLTIDNSLDSSSENEKKSNQSFFNTSKSNSVGKRSNKGTVIQPAPQVQYMGASSDELGGDGFETSQADRNVSRSNILSNVYTQEDADNQILEEVKEIRLDVGQSQERA